MHTFFRAILALWLILTIIVGGVLLTTRTVDDGFTLSLTMQQRGSLRWQQWLVDVESGQRLLAYDFAVRPERAQALPLAFFARSAADFERMNYVWVDGDGAEHIRQYPRAGDFVLSGDGAALLTLRRSSDSGTETTVVHRIWRDDGQRDLLLELSDWQPYAMSAAPDGSQVALFGAADEPRNMPRLLLVDGQQTVITLNNASAAAWSPDGRWLVVQNQGPSRDTQRFRIIDAHSGRPHPVVADVLDGRAVHWSPDGNQLYFRISSSLHVLDLPTGQSTPTDLIWIDWSPDGRFTLLTRYDQDGEAILDVRVTDSNQPLFTAATGGLAAWSADGDYLALVYPAAQIPMIHVYRMRDGQQILARPLVGFGRRPNIATPLFLR